YDIKSTPQIYILDSKKEILMKKIGAEQLGEVMDQIIKMKNDSNTTNSMAKDSQGDKIGTSKSPNIEDKLHNSQRREIKMKKRESGTFEIPCKVNGLELNLILDTGASL